MQGVALLQAKAGISPATPSGLVVTDEWLGGITNVLIKFAKDTKLLWIIISILKRGFVHPLGNQE